MAIQIALLAVPLAGCRGGSSGSDPPLPQLTTPSAVTVKSESSYADAYVSEAVQGPNFATAQDIDALNAGLVGDGKTDNTAAFNSLLGSGNRTIRIHPGDYVTGGLVIPANTVLFLDPGVTIQDSGNLASQQAFISIFTGNVYISGNGARILGDRDAYPAGDAGRAGILIRGAQNVVIQGLESSNNSGDGFYVGFGAFGDKNPSQDIVLNQCLASDNRRQGLSIISVRNLYVIDCKFQYTHGAAPQFGIDVEPDASDQLLDHIVIVNPITIANAGGGISILTYDLNANSYPIDIEIFNHLSELESPPLYTMGSLYTPGTIQYTAAPSAQ